MEKKLGGGFRILKYQRALLPEFVMPGLVPGIHDFRRDNKKDVDGRDKPGHDGGELPFRQQWMAPVIGVSYFCSFSCSAAAAAK